MSCDSVAVWPCQVFRVKCLIHTLVFKVFVLLRQAVSYYAADSFPSVASSCLSEVVISLLICLLAFLNLAKSDLKYLVLPLTHLRRIKESRLGGSWAGHVEWVVEPSRVVRSDTLNRSSVLLVVLHSYARECKALSSLVKLLNVWVSIYLLSSPKRDATSILHFKGEPVRLPRFHLTVSLVGEYVYVSF